MNVGEVGAASSTRRNAPPSGASPSSPWIRIDRPPAVPAQLAWLYDVGSPPRRTALPPNPALTSTATTPSVVLLAYTVVPSTWMSWMPTSGSPPVGTVPIRTGLRGAVTSNTGTPSV